MLCFFCNYTCIIRVISSTVMLLRLYYKLIWFALYKFDFSQLVSSTLDLQSTGRGFKSFFWDKSCVTTLGSCSHLCASVTKQYNSIPANGRWCCVAGKVTAGPAESNGSLPLGRRLVGWLPVQQDQLWAQRSVNSMGSICLFSTHLLSVIYIGDLDI